MIAKEARKNACDVIWSHLPSKIIFAIEDAVSEGKFKCEISFSIEETTDFEECIKYFNDLNQLGYTPMMNTISGKYVITILW